MPKLRDYAVITGTYWVFTLTDGALRMLVLLHLHQSGHSPLEIASLFLLYEFFGILTNLLGGWLGARFGLKLTLVLGLSLQILSCGLLAANAAQLRIPLLLVAQALSGTAKDLTKMSAKSLTKSLVPAGDGQGLLKWVAILTGSKNTLKGVGFFLGGVMLGALGFRAACLWMAGALLLALLTSALLLPRAGGRFNGKLRLADLLSKDPRIQWLSAARFFLFGSRDIWFVLALPIFLSSDLGWKHSEVGAFLALWVIGYGLLQALAPAHLARAEPDAKSLGNWTVLLLLPLGGILAGLWFGAAPLPVLIIGLVAFAAVFASGSAIHSFLIVHYARADQVSLSVGFYYMANAAGRLTGTVLSGLLFQAAGKGSEGLVWCLAGSMLFVALSALLCIPLAQAEQQSAPS